MGFKLYYFDTLPSTQDKAKQFAKEGLENIAVIAKEQTEGRGRFNRKWVSSRGGLWISFLLRPDTDKLHHLTFAAAIAAAKTIRKISRLKAKIKWPNDIYCSNHKICGILTEGVFGNDKFVIVGMGIDVNQKKFPDEIKEIASSLCLLTKKEYDLTGFANTLSDEFYNLYINFYSANRFGEIRQMWKKLSDTLGKDITIITRNKKRVSGKAFDVDENCNLMLKTLSGKVLTVMEGEVSVNY